MCDGCMLNGRCDGCDDAGWFDYRREEEELDAWRDESRYYDELEPWFMDDEEYYSPSTPWNAPGMTVQDFI